MCSNEQGASAALPNVRFPPIADIASSPWYAAGMAETQRRYRVSGIDEHGDIHAFETDVLESAEEMQKIMGEDLQDVELLTADAPASH
jgi:hypothetical protein